LLFVAHVDEIGYEITAIREDGLLDLSRRGGFYDSLFEGHAALVHTKAGTVPAIVLPRGELEGESVAPQGEGGRLGGRKVLADVGAHQGSEVAKLGIAVGDVLTCVKRYTKLLSSRAAGRSFDDRVGCTAVLHAARSIIPQRLKQKVTFAWVVQEEVGLKGAIALAEQIQPDFVFAVDTFVSSDSPREDPHMALAPIGHGAVVRAVDHSNITPLVFVDEVASVAAVHGIPLQIGTTGGGNDGAAFTHTGAINIPLSWPLRYSHSPAEVIDLKDLEALAELVTWLAYEFRGEAR
jgi:putative aminopeptidase FrvX